MTTTITDGTSRRDLKLIRALDALEYAKDFVYAIYLASDGLDDAMQCRAFAQLALLAENKITKAQRKIDRYREQRGAAEA
jgi:hypothetical protein